MVLKSSVFFLSLIPFISLVYGVFFNTLGANPIEYILHSTGFWTLTFLLITLSITPLRRINGFSKLIKIRRMLGLFSFFYAFLHFGIYLGIDRFFEWPEIYEDIFERPYITIGFTAFLLLIPLVFTSTKNSIRKMGKNWIKLHRLIYIISILGVIHFWWLVKKDLTEPIIFAIILLLLFTIRLLKNTIFRVRVKTK